MTYCNSQILTRNKSLQSSLGQLSCLSTMLGFFDAYFVRAKKGGMLGYHWDFHMDATLVLMMVVIGNGVFLIFPTINTCLHRLFLCSYGYTLRSHSKTISDGVFFKFFMG